MAEDYRNSDLDKIIAVLQEQRARAVDITAPTSQVVSSGGKIMVDTGEVEMTMDGVTPIRSELDPTSVADEGLSSRLGIPVAYLRSLRDSSLVALVDQNVNGQMRHREQEARKANKPEPRMFLRTLRPEGDAPGVLRAVLSNRYRTIDNDDVLFASLGGVMASDPTAKVVACDLSDRRMYIRVESERVKILAPDLLRGYQSPFDADPEIRRAGGWTLEEGRRAARREGMGFEPGAEPIISAGFEIRNSDIGQGGFKIVPRLVIQICRNGLTIPVDALKERHLGGVLEDGVVELSERVVRAELELITARAADAVARYLTVEYVKAKVDEINEAAGVRINRPDTVIKEVARVARFSDSERDGILRHFMTAGQPTAGGVMQAVTSYAQTVQSADAASALEDWALKSLTLAAGIASR